MQCFDEGAINEHITKRKQIRCFFMRVPCHKIFEEISRIDPQIVAFSLEQLRELEHTLDLLEWLAARERDPMDELVLMDLMYDIGRLAQIAPIRRLRLRIVAPWAMMRAPLYKNGEPQARSINDGLGCGSVHPKRSH